MRKIWFRGKLEDTGEWVDGFFTECSPTINSDSVIETCGNDYAVLKETVGQYTGLCDKNGTNVFEGDILEAVADKSFRFVVKYGTYGYNVGFYCDWISCHGLKPNNGLVFWCDKCKVVGNVCDNPKLIP